MPISRSWPTSVAKEAALAKRESQLPTLLSKLLNVTCITCSIIRQVGHGQQKTPGRGVSACDQGLQESDAVIVIQRQKNNSRKEKPPVAEVCVCFATGEEIPAIGKILGIATGTANTSLLDTRGQFGAKCGGQS